jgi:hypothetical protein
VSCQELIEKKAKHAFEWTDGVLEPKMSHYRWKDRRHGVVTFIGDKMRMQNGFGAWNPVTYECDFDGSNVLGVRVQSDRM